MLAPLSFPQALRLSAAVTATVACLAAPLRAATLKVAPDTGTGRVGEALQLTGSGFPPSSTLMILVGDTPTRPPSLRTDAGGALSGASVLLSAPLPSGRHSVVVTGQETHVFENAFAVRPVVSLDPPIGDGRAGATWRTDPAIASGGYTGMVFVLRGTGFPADAFIPADSITLGRAETIHDPIRIGPDGRLDSTTIVVASDLPAGAYSLALHNGTPSMAFASIFHVTPFATTDRSRRREASKALTEAREALKDVKGLDDAIDRDTVTRIEAGLKQASDALKDKRYGDVERIAGEMRARINGLSEELSAARTVKLESLASVMASGFDTLQPPGSPPNPRAASLIDEGRRQLKAARTAIARGDVEGAKSMLKTANDTLKKARRAAGSQAPESSSEQIRW